MELSLENIQSAVQKADEFLKINGIDSVQRIRYRLFLEGLCMDYRDFCGDAVFELKFKRLWKTILVVLRVRCGSLNPFEQRPDVHDQVLTGMESVPEWKYRHGWNFILFTLKTPMPDRSAIRYAWSYIRKENRIFTRAVVLRFVNMALSILEPIFSAWIIVAYSDSDFHKILLVAALILGRAFLSSIINYYASKLLRLSYSSALKSMQNDMVDHILKTRTDCVDRSSAGVFSQRLIQDTADFIESVDEMLEILTEAFRLISLLIAFATVSAPMLLFELVVFTVYVIIQRNHSKNIQDDGRKCRAADETRSGFVNEMVHAHRDIKLLHCEEAFREKLGASIDNSTDLLTAMRIKSMRFILLRGQFVAWTNYAYMALLAVMIANYGLSPATALVLYNYNQNSYGSIRAVAGLVSSIYSLSLSAERIWELTHSPDYAEETFGDVHLDQVRGDLAMRDVHFAYKTPEGNRTNVLNGISLEIRAGESVAFVGGSGCGKSTILSLLTRLYEPDRGDILMDGVMMRTLDRDTVRGNISMVRQNPYVFNMSIRDNLAVVKKDLTDEEMEAACRTACIHDDIMAFPNGYDTIVGESGVMMSGGQRQRLALARSLLCDSPIIILDEATSALDSVTQSEISDAIENLHGTRTIITVAHRLSTVVRCDRLFFIAEGRVLASGTHRELLENCAEYRRLYRGESGE